MPGPRRDDERQPLLQNGRNNENQNQNDNDNDHDNDNEEWIDLKEDDPEYARAWPKWRKMTNVVIISSMAIMSPLASSMFTPGIQQIADDLGVTKEAVIATTTGFVVCLGIGPLFIAPLSETFGRRPLFIICFAIFSLLQIPTALAPNVASLIAIRTLSGLFGSVSISTGGGTISDMFEPSERAGVFGWYLLGPLLGPTLGPLFGGIIVQRLGWRWTYWILLIVCSTLTLAGYFFLKETYKPAILGRRKMEKQKNSDKEIKFEGEDTRPMVQKLKHSCTRPFRILSQPIVLVMSTYQALLFATTYSLYTSMQSIFSGKYGFNTEQVGLLYLGPGLGFLSAVWFLVPRIDQVYNQLSEKHGESKPEYRLPLANIGAVLIPVSLFWFAWTVEFQVYWIVPIIAGFFYGIGQVMILNTVQNYYIDSFEQYAASAIAAGALFRSLFGGVVPLIATQLFEKVGYGWGISVFAFVSVALSPAPILFYKFGGKIREKFQVDLS